MNDQIIGTQNWWHTPLGRYMLSWEQTCYDDAVADIFGFHSLQIGLFPLQGLRNNRTPHRWLALDSADQLAQWQQSDREDVKGFAQPLHNQDSARASALGAAVTASLLCDAHALPYGPDTLDLVLLPHTLELSADPHAVLREVVRVMVPEGRVLISGINPASLWGMHTWSRRIPGLQRPLPMPDDHNLIGYGRLRDWLKLLGLELQSVSFGCFRPAMHSDAWLARWEWMDRLGPTAWPVLGGVYFVEAVKKVPSVHKRVAPWRASAPSSAARPVVAAREGLTEKTRSW